MPTFPTTRLRRLRRSPWLRRLVQESRPSVDDLIWALVVSDSVERREPTPTLAGVDRLSPDGAADAAREAQELGIPAVALFPHISADVKSADGAEALNPDGLAPQCIWAIKAAAPEIGVICDVALDPYTDHGHDGVLREGVIINDETNAQLARAAVVLAQAGADVIAPSDMMDGRIGVVRAALDDAGHQDVAILSYAAKYASAFYGPYRDAIGAASLQGQGDKRTYQMDPANAAEAIRETELDLNEGADMVMVKPGLPYLDIVRSLVDTFDAPTFAFQVSGEYAMIRAAAAQGLLDENRAVLETLMCFKRAGCAGVLTYFAPMMARALRAASA